MGVGSSGQPDPRSSARTNKPSISGPLSHLCRAPDAYCLRRPVLLCSKLTHSRSGFDERPSPSRSTSTRITLELLHIACVAVSLQMMRDCGIFPTVRATERPSLIPFDQSLTAIPPICLGLSSGLQAAYIPVHRGFRLCPDLTVYPDSTSYTKAWTQ